MITDKQTFELYEKAKSQHTLTGLFASTDKCHAFYIGEQWRGIDAHGENLPVFNMLKPIVNTKVASVAQSKMTIVLNPLNGTQSYGQARGVCDKLNSYMAFMWENQKMDTKCWQIVKDAAITGDSYLYFYDRDCKSQVIDRTSIFFADEQNPDIESQKYIIIAERRFVSDIVREAKKNGIENTDCVVADSETDVILGKDADKEVASDDGKCLSILMMWKKDSILHFCRATKTLVYVPDTAVGGMMRYPVCALRWNNKKGSARGIGEIEPLINNQIEINRSAARMQIISKLHSFPKTVYKAGAITNLASISEVGAAIEVDDATVQNVDNLVKYLQPASMSSDAMNLWQNLLANTKELSGGSDAALGNIDPEKASGTAIIAVKSQAMLPLNEQTSAYKQFVEDIASVWFAMWVAYNPFGMDITIDGITQSITQDELQNLRVAIRVDACPDSPFDRYATEQSLEKALSSGYITFEEYVGALDGNSTAPKDKFEQIIAARAQNQQQQVPAQIPQTLHTV